MGERRVLEHEGAGKAEQDTTGHGDAEGQKEDADTMKEGKDGNVGCSVKVSERLKHDNGDGVVQERLAKNDAVELGVDLECVENGENGDRIGSRQGRPVLQALDNGKRQAFEAEQSPDVDEHA